MKSVYSFFKNFFTFWGLNISSVEIINHTSFPDLFDIGLPDENTVNEVGMDADTHLCPICKHLLNMPFDEFCI
jgi:hypothetical protein